MEVIINLEKENAIRTLRPHSLHLSDSLHGAFEVSEREHGNQQTAVGSPRFHPEIVWKAHQSGGAEESAAKKSVNRDRSSESRVEVGRRRSLKFIEYFADNYRYERVFVLKKG